MNKPDNSQAQSPHSPPLKKGGEGGFIKEGGFKKFLITGSNGQVAYDLKRLLKLKNISYISMARDELNIADFESVHGAMKMFKPDIVINTAAYTQVDRAEQEKEQAYAANFHGAKNLALACQEMKSLLIHLSTDYVFDGQSTTPYSESDDVDPINLYGESKLQGEQAIQEYCEKYMILRVSAVFGIHGNNFVKTILRLARERDELRVVADQMTCPTSASSIAEIILKLCENPHWGLFHFCESPMISWHDFAKTIIDIASNYERFRIKNLQAITTEDYPTPAKRPQYSVLNCEKIRNIFGIHQSNWSTGLNDVLKQIYTT